ncbi:MAG: macro domain-containing protein, partial [Oscillospiraceae bacterium]|nr:macro domain-containing protein [Oscillospiraceae bacterium]
MPFSIVRNDITLMSVDAIVNSANPNAVIGGGVDWAIHKAAGGELIEARKKIGPIAAGNARITPGFKLKAKYVIHTVGPVWQGGDKGEEQLLAQAYDGSLKLAVENGCKSVAFP